MATPTGEVVMNPHRVTMTAPLGIIIKMTTVVIMITPTAAIAAPMSVSTTTLGRMRSVQIIIARLHVRPYAVRITLDCSIVAILASLTT